jgi:hypothetical protein
MFTEKTRGLAPEKRAQIIAALKDHPNGRAIARQVGCSNSTVSKIANEAGIELTAGKAKGRLPAEIHARIFAELKANPNASAAARKIGCSHTVAQKIARREGIELAGKKPARVGRVTKQTARATELAP